MSAYQVCRECSQQFPAGQSLGYADNLCVKCSGPPIVSYSDPKRHGELDPTINLKRRSKLVTHRKPEREAETSPPGQEDERRLERHPHSAGFPDPTETVEITEQGLESLAGQAQELPPEVPEADALSASAGPQS